MHNSLKKVEQVNKDGSIILDSDIIYSSKELKLIFDHNFWFVRSLRVDGVTLNIYSYKDIEFAIKFKNVSYLGNPHPIYKKRIQISDDLQDYYDACKKIDVVPLLMGYYGGGDNSIFVDFSIETYVNKKAHNSSAHVMVDDLRQATAEGFFEKIDYFGNEIMTFRPDCVIDFLEEKFFSNDNTFVDIENILKNRKDNDINFEEEVYPHICEFYSSVKKDWNGIECYNEMHDANYTKWKEAEWPGYYFEYVFEKYINEKNITNIITMYQDKSDNGIDLDLYFPTLDEYGDLKTHSSKSNAILGNDKNSFIEALKKGNVYYIVSELKIIKDKEMDSEVTKHWNTLLHKTNLLSYESRMKNSASIERAYVIEIGSDDFKNLSIFKQGTNSNGKKRKEKIMIDVDKINEFKTYEIEI